MPSFPKIRLHPKKERSLLLFHPWLFSGAIQSVEKGIEEGDVVEVYTHDQKYMATGHYHDGSIAVRIFSFEQTNADSAFWKNKILNAYHLREQLGLINDPQTSTYRLVHAEGDGLPGLIIDIYNSTAVIQTHTTGMHRSKKEIADALKEIYGDRISCIFDKSSETMGKQKTEPFANNYLFGSGPDAVVTENSLQFYVNWEEGQKTGFFIDQRENRQLLKRYSFNKKVLNTFCYSGGYSMYALQAGAEFVHSIDTSKKCAAWTEKNAELNGFKEKHTFISMDVFDYLKKTEIKYDLIILDPPAFAKHLSAVDQAVIGYRNLNTEGFKNINSGGILFTFSCSQVIDKNLFRKIVFQAAAQSGRNVRILHQLSQAPDHPINLYHPEGEYLKGLVLQVE